MSKKDKNLLKISQVAKIAGVLPSTVRYYTDIGLLHVSGETPGGHRLYDRESTLQTIREIQFLNQKGMTMDDIKKELTLKKTNKKILVIDDEPEIGKLVEQIVADNFPNCEVKVVYDGFTAGKLLSDYIPDLIILDIMLPGVNGFEVCQQIRHTPILANVKILSVTGYDSPENIQKIKDCGANDYLAKPMDIKILKQKISELLDIKLEAV